MAGVRAAAIGHFAFTGLARVAALALLLSACGPDAAVVDGISLEGTRWRAIEVAGLPPVAGHEPTMTFEGVPKMGSSGCNDYSWTYTSLIGGAISVRGLSVSQRLCEGGDEMLSTVEERYFAALREAGRIDIVGGRLAIETRLGTLLFEPVGVRASPSGRIDGVSEAAGWPRVDGATQRREESPSSPAQGSG